MKSQFTPGPWHVDGFHMSAVIRQDAEGQWLSVAQCDTDSFPNKNWKADARLIAAAPELYEACKRASDELKLSREYGLYDDETRALVAALDAALSKATGKDEE